MTASANELTRTNKINDLVTYLAGEEEDEPNRPPPSLPWEWDRVGHDTTTGVARDCGSQTLTRALEIRYKGRLGAGAPYCELLKHAHKAACKEYRDCKAVAGTRGLAASAKAASRWDCAASRWAKAASRSASSMALTSACCLAPPGARRAASMATAPGASGGGLAFVSSGRSAAAGGGSCQV